MASQLISLCAKPHLEHHAEKVQCPPLAAVLTSTDGGIAADPMQWKPYQGHYAEQIQCTRLLADIIASTDGGIAADLVVCQAAY